MFFSKEEIKKELEDNIKFLSSISVEENTLYHKWVDINREKWIPKQFLTIQKVKNNLWKPNNLNDYLKIKPKLIVVNNKENTLIWKILRIFTCTATFKGLIGRQVKFIVIDEPTGMYLGVICLSSDMTSIGGRDKVIGWTSEHKKKGMLNHTLIGSSIVPTQPLGFNYVGGKLLALLAVSDEAIAACDAKYKEKVVGITTTSLYGGFSQYTRLKYWKKCSTSLGKIPLAYDSNTKANIRTYFKLLFPKEWLIAKNASHASVAIPYRFNKLMNIKTPNNNMKRGVYWCPLYENSNKFLRMETKDLGKKRFKNSIKDLTDLWKEIYAKKRIKKNLDFAYQLFYDDLYQSEWKYVTEKYLKDVGR